MLYSSIRFLIRFALRAWFRRVYVINAHRIPTDKPVILAANHPNAAIDGTVLAGVLPRPLYFLARGDVFREGFANWFLRAINILPVFRMREGYANVSKNEESFVACYEVFKKNGCVLIFSEGFNAPDLRTLQPLRKGTAKLALQGVEATQTDVYVVPVGIQYTNPTQPNSEVTISFAEAIRVQDYWQIYQEHPQKGFLQLTKAIDKGLRNEVLDWQSDRMELQVNRLLVNRLSQKNDGWVSVNEKIFREEQRLFTEINALAAENIPQETQKSITRLKEIQTGKRVFLFQKLAQIIGIFNLPPHWVAQYLAKILVKLPDFKASVGLVGAFLFWLVYWVLCSIIGFFMDYTVGLLLFIGLPLTGWLALYLRDGV